MKYEVRMTSAFRKDYKQVKKRGLDIHLLDEIIRDLAEGRKLPAKNLDHALSGNWKDFRECHVLPNWLLIYRIEKDILVLTLSRTGSHSALFGS